MTAIEDNAAAIEIAPKIRSTCTSNQFLIVVGFDGSPAGKIVVK